MNEPENLQKQISILKTLVAILFVLVLGLIGWNFKQADRIGHFKELTAERINIVEKDGKLRMAISNHEQQDPGSYDGKKVAKRDRPAGMIFFNDDGDECGGLVYDGDKNSASMTYSIDQYKGDQIMQLQYAQEQHDRQLSRSYGLKLWDRNDHYPTARLMAVMDSLKALNDTAKYKAGIDAIRASGILGHERMFAGKMPDGNVGLFINDEKGNARVKLYVDKNGKGKIEFLNIPGNK